MSEPTKYRKLPVVIEAMQWDGSALGAIPIVNWALAAGGNINYHCATSDECDREECTHYLQIHTLEGVMAASPDDFIIRGVQGEFYPCKPEIFAKTYEPAEDFVGAPIARAVTAAVAAIQRTREFRAGMAFGVPHDARIHFATAMATAALSTIAAPATDSAAAS